MDGACGEGGDSFGFHWPDYAVLALSLLGSAAVGLVCGRRGGQSTAEDFLLGGGSMGTAPVALSLAASFITAIELLGNPAEVYVHGTQFWLICVPFLVAAAAASHLYLPVLHALRITSAYEYLQLRFDAGARTVAAALYVLQTALYAAVAVYAPALALSHVTGLNVYLAVSCVYAVCILYSSQGGMRAVMMTDALQAVILVVSILAVLALGSWRSGGPAAAWSLASESGRLELFNVDPSPTARHTVWSVLLGGSVYWTTMFCANQATVQKCLSVESLGQARRALWASAVGLVLVFSVNFCTGLVLYAAYHGCDPLQTEEVEASDELLPLFVMQFLSDVPGLAGLFVAGIFCASLGTVAAALNSLAAVAVKDFALGAFKLELAPERGAALGKWVSLAFGLVSFALVFLVERLGSVLQLALSFNGMVGGVTLGLFSLGMFFPWANSKGALFGALAASALVAWVGVGAQVMLAGGVITHDEKPTSVENCVCLNSSVPLPTERPEAEDPQAGPLLSLYGVSYLWYSLLGSALTLLLGGAASLATGPQDPRSLDPRLVAAPVWSVLRALPESLRRRLRVPPASRQQENKADLAADIKLNSHVCVVGMDNPGLVTDDEKLPKYKRTEE